MSTALDVVAILVKQGVLSEEQAEKVRRGVRASAQTTEQAVIQLGFANEVQIAQAIAAHAGLAYVKINPLDLDLDVVTKALSGPFARKHGLVAISKSDGRRSRSPCTIRFAAFPDRRHPRVTGLDVERVVATRSDVEAINRGFYDLKTSLKTAEKQLTARPASDRRPRQPGVSVQRVEGARSGRRARGQGARPHPELRVRAARVRHPLRAEARRSRWCACASTACCTTSSSIPKIVYQAIVSRIKLLSGCNLAEKRRPQDGRIKREQGGREVELRVSTMPTAFGEKAVLRIFDPDVLLQARGPARASRRRAADVPRVHRAPTRHHPGHRPHRQRARRPRSIRRSSIWRSRR